LEHPSRKDPFHVAQTSPKQRDTVTGPAGTKPSACWQYGEWHFVKLCPYKKHKCTLNRRGHKETQCRTKRHNRTISRYSRSSSRSRKQPKFNAVLVTIEPNFQLRRKYVTAKTNEKTFRLQLDTASDITLVSKRTWKKTGCIRYTPTINTARNASGGKTDLLGAFECEMEISGKRSRGSIFLVDCELDLFGIDWIDRLQLTHMTIDELCSSTPNQVKTESKDVLVF
uniref:Peptidase A2 domain-containing protein n=1 Tax=Echinostoma caproni TaxID=27848 RepID=A0A183AJT7_9TREM